MLDAVIMSAIVCSIREQNEHSVGDVALFVLYAVLSVAAIVTAATRRRAQSDGSAVTLAVVSPLVYFALLGFGAA